MVESPVTPVGIGKNFSGVLRSYNEVDICADMPVNSERRITRSCSRLMVKKLEARNVVQSKRGGGKSFNDPDRGRKSMDIVGLAPAGAETSDSCVEMLVNSERRITRSCSRLMKRNSEAKNVSLSKQRGRKVCKDPDPVPKILGLAQSSAEKSDPCIEMLVNLERRRSCSRLMKRNSEAKNVSLSKQRGRKLFKDPDPEPKVLGLAQSLAEKSDPCSEMLVNSGRRITHSGSRLMKGKLEDRNISKSKQKGRKVCEPKSRIDLGLVQPSAVKLSSEVKRRTCNKGKENRSDSVNGSKTITSVSDLHCVTRGGRRGLRNNLANDHENDGKAVESCNQMVENLDRRITRSASKTMVREKDLHCRTLERQSTHSKLVAGKAGTVKPQKYKQGDSGLVQSSAVRLSSEVKRITCDNGKANGSDSVSGSKTTSSLSHCVTRGGRRGVRSNLAKDHEKDGKSDDSSEQVEKLDRRITRSASKKVGGENDLFCRTMERQRIQISSNHVAGKAETIKARKEKQDGSGSIKHLGTEPLKRMWCSEEEEKSMKNAEAKEKDSYDCVKLDIPGKETKLTGVKRKRNQVGLHGTYQGWTKEQEVALRKAYFTAKPSPHFWKKVSKLVPGKSAQECFDKVHSDHQTPLCTKQSSRAQKQNSPFDLLVSGCELFKSAEPKSKRPCKKYKSHVARKNVRQLLQKYCQTTGDTEADLFAVLEPSVNSSAEALQLSPVQLTPKHLPRTPNSSSKSHARSSSGHKKFLSRFSYGSASPLTSPPVLKKVKNMALHDRYIDQLHIRENKRKVAFSRGMKSACNQKDGKKNSTLMKDNVKAAKEALVSDAKDAINTFQHSQANIMEANSDSEEFLNIEDDDVETVL